MNSALRWAISVSLASTALFAAPVGSVKGYIKDSSGSVVPAANITLKNTATGLVRLTTSSPDGAYQFLQVEPATYVMTAEAAGFRTAEARDIQVLVDQIVTFDISLQVGQVTETVEVQSLAALIEPDKVSTGANIDPKYVTGLPTANRRFNDLAVLTPGVTFSAAGTQAGGFAAAGSRAQSTNWQIDGITAMDPQVAGPTQSYRIAEAVQEFSILTTGYSAEFGRQSGAQVNVVTKSGTNQFHGSAFEFLRNDALQAKDFFTNKLNGIKNKLRHNQYGATIGGPVLRDKTFFFFSWERLDENAPTPASAVVPTQAQRDAVRDPIARKLLAYFPLPTNPSAAAGTTNYVGNAPGVNKDNTYLAKIDHNFSTKDRLSARYLWYGGTQLVGGALPTTGGNTNAPGSQNVSIIETRTWTPTFLTELRAGYSRNKTDFKVQDAGFNAATILTSSPGTVDATTNLRDSGIPNISITGGYATLGSATNLPQGRITNSYELYLNNTKILGRHTIKFGYNIRREEARRFLDGNSRGAITFAGWDQFAGTCSDCNGQSLLLSSSIRSGDTLAHYYRYPQAFYVQDEFKVMPNLTLSAGLRWELPSVATEKRNKGTNFIDGVGPVLLGTNTLLTLDPTKKGYAAFGSATAPFSISSAGTKAQYKDFGPVFGFAYTPKFAPRLFGDGKTVIRGGFRVGFDEVFNNIPVNQSLNAPFILTTTQRAGTTQPSIGYGWALAFDQNIPLVARTTQKPGSPAVGLVSFNGYDPNAPTSYAYNWNFGFQREVTRSFSMDVSYIGSAGHKLGVFIDANQPNVVINNPAYKGTQSPNSQFFPFPQWSTTSDSYATFQGNSIFHGLVISAKIRTKYGLQMNSSYTWSHGLDNSSAFFGSTLDPGYPDTRYNLSAERSNSANDQRHRFVNFFTYDIPVGKGRKFMGNAPAAVNQVLGGWSISGITNLTTGQPFTVLASTSVDFSGFNQFVDRPDIQGTGPLQLNRGNPDNFFSPAYFGKVAGNPICPGYAADSGVRVNSGCAPAGRVGTSPRNGYYGPGLMDYDMSLFKRFPFWGESRFVEFRSDFFNLLNHTNFALTNGNRLMSNGTFGQLSQTVKFAGNTGGPRVIQLTLKVQF